jgi:hypothetical protein
MMSFLMMVAVILIAAVSAALGLERGLHFDDLCFEVKEHLFDHMIRSNTKNLIADFSWQVSIA